MQSQESAGEEITQADAIYYLAVARRMRAEWFSNQLGAISKRVAEWVCRPLFGCGGPVVNH